jgi:ATP phosphoribosyltransferase
MNVALPKGHLQAGVLDRLAEVGYSFSFSGDRDYHPRRNVSSLTAKMFKARAIPQLVHLGLCDVGFHGRYLIANRFAVRDAEKGAEIKIMTAGYWPIWFYSL